MYNVQFTMYNFGYASQHTDLKRNIKFHENVDISTIFKICTNIYNGSKDGVLSIIYTI